MSGCSAIRRSLVIPVCGINGIRMFVHQNGSKMFSLCHLPRIMRLALITCSHDLLTDIYISRVYGSYENIDGGFINTALVDFTGGISEEVRLRKKSELPSNLFELMVRMFKMNSMMGCSIDVSVVAWC